MFVHSRDLKGISSPSSEAFPDPSNSGDSPFGSQDLDVNDGTYSSGARLSHDALRLEFQAEAS